VAEVERPRLKREWKGRHVVTRVELRNGWGVVPAGTRMVVDENRRASTRTPGSLALSTEKRCECCGLRAIINGVRELDVELLPEVDDSQRFSADGLSDTAGRG
jgi:hypothetical protein